MPCPLAVLPRALLSCFVLQLVGCRWRRCKHRSSRHRATGAAFPIAVSSNVPQQRVFGSARRLASACTGDGQELSSPERVAVMDCILAAE